MKNTFTAKDAKDAKKDLARASFAYFASSAVNK